MRSPKRRRQSRSAQSSDTARYMQEGRSMRNAVMIELLAGAWTMLAKGVRHIVRRSRSTTAFS